MIPKKKKQNSLLSNIKGIPKPKASSWVDKKKTKKKIVGDVCGFREQVSGRCCFGRFRVR
jgi:hypothetical protein